MNSALPGIGIRATFGALYPYDGREVPPLGGCCSGGVVDMELLSVGAPVPGRARAPARSHRNRRRTTASCPDMYRYSSGSLVSAPDRNLLLGAGRSYGSSASSASARP